MDDGGARYVARWEVGDTTGVVVAVDVLRAFTTAAYALDRGADCILLVAAIDEALSLGRSIPGALIMGEEHGRRPEGFDFSNSPVEVAGADLAGRTLVQRTGAGTVGMVAAARADRLFAASLVCASATAEAVRRAGPEPPTYLITGRFPDDPAGGVDDLLTAQLIERARRREDLDAARTAAGVAASEEAARTLAAGEGHVHPDDIAFATDVDRFTFAMEARRVDGRLKLARYEVGV